MKGKYITTSLMIAVLGGGKTGTSILTDETCASVKDHTFIWSREKGAKQQQADRDELKTV